jgi:hypothetical protein
LRRVDRCASPLVAERVCARVAASGRGGWRARERDRRGAFVFARRRCEAALAPRRVSSADDDVDHRGRDHDDDGTTDHDDDDAGAGVDADDHDDFDGTPAPADHHDDDRTAGGRGDEQRRR